MSEDLNLEREEDGNADAFAATAIISLVVLTMTIWLAGMPS